MNTLKIIPMILVLALLSACSQETPIDSLTSKEISKKYDRKFWMNEANQHTALWKQAKKICVSSTPNCMTVASIENELFAK